MRLSRLCGLAAIGPAVLGLVVAFPTSAAEGCKLVEDPAGDTFLIRVQDGTPVLGPQEDSLDITSVDVASDGTTLTAVVRVVALAESVTTSPNGFSARVQFSVDGLEDENLYVDARREGGGAEVFTAGVRAITANVSTKLADAEGTFDMEKGEIRIHAPLAAFAAEATVASGTELVLSGLDQTTSRFVGTNPATGAGTAAFADVVQPAQATYAVGTPNCVVVGA